MLIDSPVHPPCFGPGYTTEIKKIKKSGCSVVAVGLQGSERYSLVNIESYIQYVLDIYTSDGEFLHKSNYTDVKQWQQDVEDTVLHIREAFPYSIFFALIDFNGKLIGTARVTKKNPSLICDLEATSDDGLPIFYFLPDKYSQKIEKAIKNPELSNFVIYESGSFATSVRSIYHRIDAYRILAYHVMSFVEQLHRVDPSLAVIIASSDCAKAGPEVWRKLLGVDIIPITEICHFIGSSTVGTAFDVNVRQKFISKYQEPDIKPQYHKVFM
ncbi:hypothetical protein [Zooshikella sp. RANM57]|uniref:hypothetical protein n=1 Tax=Zooshikella sp. RANM57 TaxID=3425863 RepID=UPI003D6DB7FF